MYTTLKLKKERAYARSHKAVKRACACGGVEAEPPRSYLL